jgi:predicted Zn-dependent protease
VSDAHLPFGRTRLLELCAAAVGAARAAGADEAEASFDGAALGFTRFAGSYFTQAGQVVEPALRVRAMVEGRLGAAVTSRLDVVSLSAAARRAVEAARRQSKPERPFPGFARPDSTRVPATGRFSPATAAAGPEARAALCARLFARAAHARLVCAGALRCGPRELAVVTSNGVASFHAFTEVALGVIALDDDASSYVSFHGPDIGALDIDELADRAVTQASRARDAIVVEPGEHDVVLAAPALAEALEWLSMTSFSARSLLDEGSLLCGRAPGSPVCSPQVNLFDDVAYDHPAVIATPFDAEGVTRRRVDFLRAGTTGEVVSDRGTAAVLGGQSTGHAPGVVNDLSDGPGPATLIFGPGHDSEAQLISRIERGLFVTRFHYVNGFLDTRRATMTGMTRDGLYRIENGKLGKAVRNLRWTDSFLSAFSAERLSGVGRELVSQPTSWSKLGQVLCPAVAVRGFKFTGASR